MTPRPGVLRIAQTGPISWVVIGLATAVFVLVPRVHPALILIGGGAAYVAAHFAGYTTL